MTSWCRTPVLMSVLLLGALACGPESGQPQSVSPEAPVPELEQADSGLSAQLALWALSPTNQAPALSWKALTGAASYRVLRDDRAVATVKTLSFTDATLTANGSHAYQVVALKASGASLAQSRVLAVVFDDTAPSAPSALAAVDAADGALVSWAASSDAASGVAQYQVLRDGVVVNATDGLSFVDAAVVAGTTYRYTVVATDLAQNVSATSAAVSFTRPLPLTVPQRVSGTWALQQVSSVQDLRNRRAAIDAALSVSGVRGFSMRFPWNAVATDAELYALLDEGRAIADAHGVAYSVRFMAGRWTPASVFAQGAFFYTLSSGEKVPKPFSDAGVAGNPVFEAAFLAMVQKLATYSKAHGMALLHLPWYGQKWAEIDNGPEVAASAGYSWAAWLEGHNRLADLGLSAAGPQLAVEFPLSGHWTQANGGAQIVAHVVGKVGQSSPLIFVQGNGLGMFNSAPTASLLHGMQMYDGGDYDWASLYATLTKSPPATYVEIYVDSFSKPGKASLAAEIARFAH